MFYFFILKLTLLIDKTADGILGMRLPTNTRTSALPNSLSLKIDFVGYSHIVGVESEVSDTDRFH